VAPPEHLLVKPWILIKHESCWINLHRPTKWEI
jgi:hypothetical protein